MFCFREFSQALVRLTKMIRGMGDPLAAVYARTYICRVRSKQQLNILFDLMPGICLHTLVTYDN